MASLDPETLSALKLALLCEEGYWGDKFLPKPVGSKLSSLKRAPKSEETLLLSRAYSQDILQKLQIDLPISAEFSKETLVLTLGSHTWNL